MMQSVLGSGRLSESATSCSEHREAPARRVHNINPDITQQSPTSESTPSPQSRRRKRPLRRKLGCIVVRTCIVLLLLSDLRTSASVLRTSVPSMNNQASSTADPELGTSEGTHSTSPAETAASTFLHEVDPVHRHLDARVTMRRGSSTGRAAGNSSENVETTAAPVASKQRDWSSVDEASTAENVKAERSASSRQLAMAEPTMRADVQMETSRVPLVSSVIQMDLHASPVGLFGPTKVKKALFVPLTEAGADGGIYEGSTSRNAVSSPGNQMSECRRNKMSNPAAVGIGTRAGDMATYKPPVTRGDAAPDSPRIQWRTDSLDEADGTKSPLKIEVGSPPSISHDSHSSAVSLPPYVSKTLTARRATFPKKGSATTSAHSKSLEQKRGFGAGAASYEGQGDCTPVGDSAPPELPAANGPRRGFADPLRRMSGTASERQGRFSSEETIAASQDVLHRSTVDSNKFKCVAALVRKDGSDGFVDGNPTWVEEADHSPRSSIPSSATASSRGSRVARARFKMLPEKQTVQQEPLLCSFGHHISDLPYETSASVQDDLVMDPYWCPMEQAHAVPPFFALPRRPSWCSDSPKTAGRSGPSGRSMAKTQEALPPVSWLPSDAKVGSRLYRDGLLDSRTPIRWRRRRGISKVLLRVPDVEVIPNCSSCLCQSGSLKDVAESATTQQQDGSGASDSFPRASGETQTTAAHIPEEADTVSANVSPSSSIPCSSCHRDSITSFDSQASEPLLSACGPRPRDMLFKVVPYKQARNYDVLPEAEKRHIDKFIERMLRVEQWLASLPDVVIRSEHRSDS